MEREKEDRGKDEILKKAFQGQGYYGWPPLDPGEMEAIYNAMDSYLAASKPATQFQLAASPEMPIEGEIEDKANSYARKRIKGEGFVDEERKMQYFYDGAYWMREKCEAALRSRVAPASVAVSEQTAETCEHPFAFVHSRCNGEINKCLKCGAILNDSDSMPPDSLGDASNDTEKEK